jgi:hypothetical protein
VKLESSQPEHITDACRSGIVLPKLATREQLVTTVLILTCAATLLLSGEKIRGHFGKGQNSIAHLRRSGAPELVDCFVGQQILRWFENSFANGPSSVALLATRARPSGVGLSTQKLSTATNSRGTHERYSASPCAARMSGSDWTGALGELHSPRALYCATRDRAASRSLKFNDVPAEFGVWCPRCQAADRQVGNRLRPSPSSPCTPGRASLRKQTRTLGRVMTLNRRP